MFQEDIYPDTLSGEPSLSADEWFAGSNVGPNLVSMESIYKNGNAQTARQRQFVPQASPEPEARKVPSEAAKATVRTAGPVETSETSVKSTGAPVDLPTSTSPAPSKAPAFEVKSSQFSERKDDSPKQVHIPDSAAALPSSVKQPQVCFTLLAQLIL
jgi:hypothetical protein